MLLDSQTKFLPLRNLGHLFPDFFLDTRSTNSTSDIDRALLCRNSIQIKMQSIREAKDKDYRCNNQRETRKLMHTDPISLLDKWFYAEQARQLEQLERTFNPESVMFV